MTGINLTLKRQPDVPLETEVIVPDQWSDLAHADIAALQVYHGKRKHRLDEFFDIDGERSDHLTVHGDLSRVRMIGRRMKHGSLSIHGDVGMHLGSFMSGGSIRVHGNVGDWLGAEMTGGSIQVHGDAGGQIGAAYRGSLGGMKDGTILIDGSAGIEVGMRMRRGTIVIGGMLRDFAGLQMKGGTIVTLGGAEIRTGAWMTRGTIISMKPISIMPTFFYSGTYDPVFMRLYQRHLKTLGVDLPCDPAQGVFERFSGDKGVPGKGELLVWKPNA